MQHSDLLVMLEQLATACRCETNSAWSQRGFWLHASLHCSSVVLAVSARLDCALHWQRVAEKLAVAPALRPTWSMKEMAAPLPPSLLLLLTSQRAESRVHHARAASKRTPRQ